MSLLVPHGQIRRMDGGKPGVVAVKGQGRCRAKVQQAAMVSAACCIVHTVQLNDFISCNTNTKETGFQKFQKVS